MSVVIQSHFYVNEIEKGDYPKGGGIKKRKRRISLISICGITRNKLHFMYIILY